jgi:tRNA-dihydrouridine synthase 2
MVRAGELPSRLTALKYGADLVWGPEIVDRALLTTIRRVDPRTQIIEFVKPETPFSGHPQETNIFRVHPTERGKLICQIGTACPILAVQAARIVAKDVSGIDVNAGCPLAFSTLGGMGAALLQTPRLFITILEALVKEVGEPAQIGISTKIRILDDPQQTADLVKSLVKTGITGLTVHCRTSTMRATTSVLRGQLRMIGEICRDSGVACLMNGEVADRDHAIQLVEEYGVDGAMIASAAEANFSVFRSTAQGGLAQWREVAEDYVNFALSVENHFANTKYVFGRLIPGRAQEFGICQSAKGYSDLIKVFGLSKEHAERVDSKRRS